MLSWRPISASTMDFGFPTAALMQNGKLCRYRTFDSRASKAALEAVLKPVSTAPCVAKKSPVYTSSDLSDIRPWSSFRQGCSSERSFGAHAFGSRTLGAQGCVRQGCRTQADRDVFTASLAGRGRLPPRQRLSNGRSDDQRSTHDPMAYQHFWKVPQALARCNEDSRSQL